MVADDRVLFTMGRPQSERHFEYRIKSRPLLFPTSVYLVEKLLPFRTVDFHVEKSNS